MRCEKVRKGGVAPVSLQGRGKREGETKTVPRLLLEAAKISRILRPPEEYAFSRVGGLAPGTTPDAQFFCHTTVTPLFTRSMRCSFIVGIEIARGIPGFMNFEKS